MRPILALVLIALAACAIACDPRQAPNGTDGPRPNVNGPAIDANRAPAATPSNAAGNRATVSTATLAIHLSLPRIGTRVFVDGRAVATVGPDTEQPIIVGVEVGSHRVARIWYDTARHAFDTRAWTANAPNPSSYATYEATQPPAVIGLARTPAVYAIAQPRSQEHMLEILDGKLRYVHAGWSTFTAQPNWQTTLAAADHASTTRLDRPAVYAALSIDVGGARELEVVDLPALQDWFSENARYRMDDYCEVGACPMRIGEQPLPAIAQRWQDTADAIDHNLAIIAATFERLRIALEAAQ